MPHNPDLVEHILKEAGLFDSLKDRMLAPFRSREKKRAAARSSAHFDAKDKDWDRFVGNAKRKSFVAAIANDPRADSKLKMHVENMNRLKTGKVLGTVMGTEGSRTARRDGAQSYKIVKLRGSDRLGCTCRDWRFKKSVAQPGEQVDCKHIREFKQVNKTASSDPNIYITGHSGSGKSTLARKLSEERGLPILELDKTPEFRQFLEMQKQNYRSTGSLGLKKTKKEERAALKAALSNIKRPHIVEGSYFLANTDLLPSESEVHLVDRPTRDILKQRVERTVAKDIARGRKADPDRPRKIGEELIRYYQPGVEHLRSRSGVKIAASRLREQFRVEEDGFRPTSAGEGGGRTQYKLMLGDKQIGMAEFAQNSDHVANIHIDKKYRGLGLGRKAYGDLAALRGGSISTGDTTSGEARRVWERMSGVKKHPPTMPHLTADDVYSQVLEGDLKFPRSIDQTRASREFYTRTLPKGATPENLKATYARNARRIAAREEAAAKAKAAAAARRAAQQRAAKIRKLKMAAGAAVGTGVLIGGGYALNRHRKKKTYGEVKKEAAEITATLKPHQERVLRKLEDSDGVIVAHRVGAGKTLTSIAAGVRSGAPMEIITPASLTKNYEKEIKKHVKGEVKARVTSYEKAVRRRTREDQEAIEPGSFLVLDEAHRLRNQSLTRRTLKPESELAHKRILLTGTALYNQPYDIAPLANIAAGETVLPADPMEFRRKFIRETEVSPGFLNRMVGVKPGIRRDLQNAAALKDALVGRIDVHSEASPEDFPEQIDERINVPMSGKQKEVYNAVMGAAPWHVRRKIRAGLPPSKQESRRLNAFTTAGRQASLSPKPYVDGMTEEEEALHTPKIQEAARRLHEAKKKDRRFRGVVYSNYIEAGLKPYERALKKKKIKFNTLTGKLNAKQKAQMVDEYNSGKVPVLLVSSSGTEGLDLKGTKMVQVLEPHWNNSKIDQVIGRGVRYQSHAHLPPSERKVHVQRYYSSLPKGFLGMNPGKSTEQWIQDRADEKTELANQMRAVFQQASDTEKEAGHVEDRIAERAPGSTYEVAKIRASIPHMNLRKGQTYHVPLKGGKGYVVIGDIGKKHVVKTVLGPNMRPPGHRKMASSSALADQVGLQKGDVLLMTPKKSKKPLTIRDRAVGAAFSTISTGLQGSHAHAGIYVGDGQVVEARIREGVKKRSLRSAMSGVDSMIAVRPKTKKKDRAGAAEFAKKRVGRDYDSIAFLAGQGASILIPEKMSKRLISRKQNPEDAEKFICGNLVSAAYASQGFSPKGAKNWDLTVPRDFLDPRTNKRVAVIGKQESSNAAVGRFAGQEKISKAPTHRKEILGDTEFYLDSEIPLITSLPTDPTELDAALRAHIGEAKSSRWSHPQIAIPASVDLSGLPGAKRTRFSVPLPGERLGTLSTRVGNLHAHTRGPVHLVHLDAHNPLSGIRSIFGHIPETYGAVKKRFSSARPDPFVKAAATRNYKKEYQDYHGKPEQIANRSMRNQARRKMGLKNGDPREVDHQTPLSKGGGNGKANLRAISRRANRTKFTDRS